MLSFAQLLWTLLIFFITLSVFFLCLSCRSGRRAHTIAHAEDLSSTPAVTARQYSSVSLLEPSRRVT